MTRSVSDQLKRCGRCGADWTWFVWDHDDEPPCECDLGPVESDEIELGGALGGAVETRGQGSSADDVAPEPRTTEEGTR